MSQNNIDLGAFPDDPSADSIRTALTKVQNNFNQLFQSNVDSAVTSINRTPGAGITINYPTGNVIISANIACLQVATSSLKMGKGSDNTNVSVTITSSSQTLNIDIDPAQVLSNYFAAVGNTAASFKGQFNTASNAQPNITSLGTLTGLTVSGNADLTGPNVAIGNVGNLYIPGGALGYGLVTDGSGNLSWSAVTTGNGVVGGVNTQVQFNNAGLFGGNTGFTFDNVTGIFTSPFLAGDGNGLANIPAANISGTIANANYATYSGTANTLSSSGNANIGNIGVTGGVFATTLSATGNANIGNIGTGIMTATGNANVGNLGTTGVFATTLSATGNANVGNLGTSAIIATTVSATGNANVGNIGTTGVFATTISATGNANIGNIGTAGILSVSGNATVGGNVIISGNLSVLGNTTYYNVTSFNVQDPIISLGGGANGVPLTTNDGKDRGTALEYYAGTPITAFMGWDNSNSEFAFGSNVSLSSEVATFNTFGNIRADTVLSNIVGATANFTSNINSGNANLGNAAVSNYFIGIFYGQANTAITAATVTTNAQSNITSLGTLSSLSVSGNVAAGNLVGRLANGNSNVNIPAADGNVNISSIGNANVVVITATGANITGTLSASSNITAAALYGPLANGNSNVNIPLANGNINFSAVGNANIIIVSGTGANVTGTFNVSGNANVGNIGTTGVFATTLSATGNANVGNIGTTGVFATTLSATGNANVGNLGTTGVFSTTLSATGNVTGANVISSSYNILSVGTGISAAGSTQGTATPLTKSINVVSTVLSGNGVVLPTAVAGMTVYITNTNGNNLIVYPATGGQINSLGSNSGLTHVAGATLTYIAPTTTQWYTVGATYA